MVYDRYNVILLYTFCIACKYFKGIYMKYAIQINSSPFQSNTGQNAYHFISTALKKNHEIICVFFYYEGIYHAMRYNNPPDDEANLTKQWSQLAKEYQLNLLVCVSAAQRRGLLSQEEAIYQGKKDNDIADGFKIAGLGQWIESLMYADSIIIFP